MWLGVDYYPEQWDPALMDADMDTIREMGGNVIRIAEFSWHLMERTEGNYDFSFFDRVIAKAGEKGLHVIMGTPTATIPAWLAKKHPDILSQLENGQRRAFGGRHVCCYNSPELYAYSEKIVRALVGHYKGEKQIAAWQIDNELGHEGSDLCWCPQCRRAFQDFLREKFNGDIDKLNHTYGTTFWSQEYNDFDEIPLPAETVAAHNPALRLDWERFRSHSIVRYMEFQARLIRETDPEAVIIHDFPGGGLDKHVDYSQAAKCLDIAAYNNYPVWGGQNEPVPPHEIAFGLDYIRGLKGQNFWITEAIMGAQGHDVTGFLPRPNQAKMWSCQGMAHGCTAMLYFRYRGAVKGAEQFCYGVIDADNVKGRKFREVQSFFQDISRYERALSAPIPSEVAIVYDYDCLASFRIQRQSILLDCQNEMKKLYKPFYDGNVPVDVIPAQADISQYKVVLLPQMIIARESFQERVKDFVRRGGTLVLTYRSAVKDTDNNLPFGQRVPVGFGELAGVWVEETESLHELNAFPVIGENGFEGETGSGGIFRDMLKVRDAQVLYRYGDPFYIDYAAVTRRRQGEGTVYYLGCALDEKTTARIMRAVLAENQIDTIPSDSGVEVAVRGSGGQKVRILMNHNAVPASALGVTLPPFGYVIEPV
ncbi:beta-galactosidase [Flintibacter muris]|uniref:beta-galactosidase n=1 Tax=Flintibacter muris TaxID=2941327 RepID=UPI00203DE11D|nr:beta-galactosidase [Flintibacter muris]